MRELKYLAGYSEGIASKVKELIAEEKLGSYLISKYPTAHGIRTDRALYDYAVELKNEFLRKAQPLSKVSYDCKISVINHALGMHAFVSRVQGAKLKSKHELSALASVGLDL